MNNLDMNSGGHIGTMNDYKKKGCLSSFNPNNALILLKQKYFSDIP